MKRLSIVFAPAIAIGIHNPGCIKQRLGACNIIASPLQVCNGRMIIQGLLAKAMGSSGSAAPG